MRRVIEEAYQKAAAFHDKHNDPELDDYLMSIVGRLEDAETMYHNLGYLFMHVRATVAHGVRPAHLQEALDRAERVLKRHRDDGQT